MKRDENVRKDPPSELVAEALFVEAEKWEEARDFKQAVRCLRRAAELGHSSSQLNLGNFYAAGTGLKKNLKQAAYWYKAAFKRGNVTAARNLGIDRAAAGNIRSAIFWFKKGVENCDGGSLVALARIYARQRGGKMKAMQLLKRMDKLSRSEASDLDREQAKDLRLELERFGRVTSPE